MVEYNFAEHVASDVGLDSLNFISNWTKEYLMQLNSAKCSYMIFSRCKADFTTRLTVNNTYLERIKVTKLLGVWISEDLSWSKNCKEICKKAYSKLSMITKLKYAGVSLDDLIEIYSLFIRSTAEYCSVVFHSSLTVEQTDKIEIIQKVCLKVILGDQYISYYSDLQLCGLKTLSERRQDRCLNFAKKCIKHPKNQRLFPLRKYETGQAHFIRNSEPFEVNFASGSKYQNSAIPYCQILNLNFK